MKIGAVIGLVVVAVALAAAPSDAVPPRRLASQDMQQQDVPPRKRVADVPPRMLEGQQQDVPPRKRVADVPPRMLEGQQQDVPPRKRVADVPPRMLEGDVPPRKRVADVLLACLKASSKTFLLVCLRETFLLANV
ncbi:uncharacterized protein KRP23_10954 [Phytophthora ramorum]|uniref:uncharacterized protein n=1 Tax=Phytophthora ramorum TaxID=164328 RepID=UPI00309A9933|nr:hypothetical protein KRP23_10954 [Phytophthora ramorum]